MCWSNHQVARAHWQRDTRRSVRDQTADLRVSDAEREHTIQQLSRHTGDGRLTLEEFEERVAEVLDAKTRAELDATLRSLPVERERTRRRTPLRVRLRPVTVVALMALLVVAVGPWILWLAIPWAWCRLNSGWHRDWQEPARAQERDDLTLV